MLRRSWLHKSRLTTKITFDAENAWELMGRMSQISGQYRWHEVALRHNKSHHQLPCSQSLAEVIS